MTTAEPTTAMATIYSEHVGELVVAEREPVADGVVSLVLEHPDQEELPAWTPGAHVDLLLAPDLTRQYSLCGSPADRSRWRLGVLLDPGGRGGVRHPAETRSGRLPAAGSAAGGRGGTGARDGRRPWPGGGTRRSTPVAPGRWCRRSRKGALP